MTRSGNRRRRVPYYPATAGIFQPKDQQGSDQREGMSTMDYKNNGIDRLRDRQINGSDQRNDGGNGRLDGRDRPQDPGDGQVNGSDRRHNAGVWPSNGPDRGNDVGDHQLDRPGCRQDVGDRQINGQDVRHAQNESDHLFEGFDRRSDLSKKDPDEQKLHASDSRLRRSQSRDRPTNHYQHPHHHHHHHQQKNQRWEGKDSNDQNKDPALTIAKELEKKEGKSNGKVHDYTTYMASQARELKEEGNRRFQRKDYKGAMDQYELALKLTPPLHPDCAIFHSNRAACLMQMKPVQFDAAIHECNLALEAHPGFARALLRRARAYEAVGNLELALKDVQLLLQGDVSHPDALDMAKRIRSSMGISGDEVQQDLQGRLPTPAALGRAKSCVGPSSVASSKPETLLSASRSFCMPDHGDSGSVLTPFRSLQQMQTPPGPSKLDPCRSFQEKQSPHQVSSSRLMQMPPSPPSKDLQTERTDRSMPSTPPTELSKVDSSEKIIHQDNSQTLQSDTPTAPLMRPLKLIYDHDIRLAEMPVNCKFGELRNLVKGKFPSSKAILLKYRDVEGDLVTITSTEELRLAETAAAVEAVRRNLRMASLSADGGVPQDRRPNSAIGLPVVPSVLDQLRLHVVEVPPEQEPHNKEENLVVYAQQPIDATEDGVAKTETSETKAVNEKEFDKWLIEFAHLFRTHLGIDPNKNVDFHALGMDLCAEALEETITTEEAHKLLEQAGHKFQDMVAMGFFNWGNVYMCAARKEVPQDTDDDQMDFFERLKASFDWAHAQYALAEEKFLLALKVKPDFCDGMLGLGQKDFERAKLNWSLAVASQRDLKAWGSSETLDLFRSAEAHAQRAAELLAKQEDSHSKGTEAFNVQGIGDAQHETASLTQDAALKTQIYLFWGNILYEHSQVEFRLELHAWKELLDAAVHAFEVAGASSSDITTAMQKHLSSSSTFLDARREASHEQEGDWDAKGEKIIEREGTAEGEEKAIEREEEYVEPHADNLTNEEPSHEEHAPTEIVSELLPMDSS